MNILRLSDISPPGVITTLGVGVHRLPLSKYLYSINRGEGSLFDLGLNEKEHQSEDTKCSCC